MPRRRAQWRIDAPRRRAAASYSSQQHDRALLLTSPSGRILLYNTARACPHCSPPPLCIIIIYPSGWEGPRCGIYSTFAGPRSPLSSVLAKRSGPTRNLRVFLRLRLLRVVGFTPQCHAYHGGPRWAPQGPTFATVGAHRLFRRKCSAFADGCRLIWAVGPGAQRATFGAQRCSRLSEAFLFSPLASSRFVAGVSLRAKLLFTQRSPEERKFKYFGTCFREPVCATFSTTKKGLPCATESCINAFDLCDCFAACEIVGSHEAKMIRLACC